MCPEGSTDRHESAEAVGTVNADEYEDDLAVDLARSSGDIVTCAAALPFVLPMFLSGVAVFL